MIKGDKVKIRKRKISDARDEYTWCRDPELAELDAAPPLTLSYPRFLGEFHTELLYSGPSRQRFAIETLDGVHIGNCSYYNIDPDRAETELGILIGNRDYWNKGYGEDTINALLKHLFEKNRFKRVYLKTLEWNTRAHKCFEKCGFVTYNHAHRDGYHFRLMEIFELQWQVRQKERETYETGIS